MAHQLGDLVVPLELDHRLSETVLDVLANSLGLVELRLLHEDADGRARSQECLAVARLVQSGHDLEDAGFTSAVRSDDTDLRAGVKAHRDVIEDDLVTVRLAHLLHRVNELSHDRQPIGVCPITHIARWRSHRCGFCGQSEVIDQIRRQASRDPRILRWERCPRDPHHPRYALSDQGLSRVRSSPKLRFDRDPISPCNCRIGHVHKSFLPTDGKRHGEQDPRRTVM